MFYIGRHRYGNTLVCHEVQKGEQESACVSVAGGLEGEGGSEEETFGC